MAELFASGRIIDLILVLLVVEGLALLAWQRWFRQGPQPLDLLPNLVAGGLLLVALRAALTGAAWPWIALPLALALPAHLADLSRLRRRDAS
jgi:hypothetical protein